MTMPPVVDDPVTLFYRRQWPRARRRQPHRPAMETPERSDPRDEKLAPLDPAGIAPALAAALGVGERPALATLQLKAEGVFVSIRGRRTRHNRGARRAPGPACAPGHTP